MHVHLVMLCFTIHVMMFACQAVAAVGMPIIARARVQHAVLCNTKWRFRKHCYARTRHVCTHIGFYVVMRLVLYPACLYSLRSCHTNVFTPSSHWYYAVGRELAVIGGLDPLLYRRDFIHMTAFAFV